VGRCLQDWSREPAKLALLSGVLIRKLSLCSKALVRQGTGYLLLTEPRTGDHDRLGSNTLQQYRQCLTEGKTHWESEA